MVFHAMVSFKAPRVFWFQASFQALEFMPSSTDLNDGWLEGLEA